MNYTFKQILIKDHPIIIDIKLKNHIANIPIDIFIKEYKISNFWTGKFFVKRLINKIFKYNLNKKLIWDENFWNNISINLFESKISNIVNDSNSFKDKITQSMSSSRLNDVKKYKDLLNKGIDLGSPLYITSQCLNLLGADISKDKFYILDGSRRLVAYTMLNMNPEILLLDINK